MKIGLEDFEALVAAALDRLPSRFVQLLENVAVVVEDNPTAADLRAVGLDPARDDLLGLYQGVPRSDRDVFYDALPDRVVLYRQPIARMCTSRREIVQEIYDTLVHELGHHFGLEDGEMPY